MRNYLERIVEAEERSRTLESELADPDVARQRGKFQQLAKELGSLRSLVEVGAEYRSILDRIEDSSALVDDEDPELAELARSDFGDAARDVLSTGRASA